MASAKAYALLPLGRLCVAEKAVQITRPEPERWRNAAQNLDGKAPNWYIINISCHL